jgi:hypothetical protein
MPQKTGDRAKAGGASTDKKATQDKEHRNRSQPDVVLPFGEDFEWISPEPSQGKAVRKNNEDRQNEPEEPESIIVWIERLSEVWSLRSGAEIHGMHPASVSRNRAATVRASSNTTTEYLR